MEGRGEGAVHDMRRYLVAEFIEEYEDGSLDRATLERRIVGVVGPEEAIGILANVPQARIAWNDMLEFFSRHLAG